MKSFSLTLLFAALSDAYHPKNSRHELTTTSLQVGRRCCQRLQYICGSDLFFPDSQISLANTNLFQNQQNGSQGYWTQQESSITPACRFSPSNTKEVSRAVAFLSRSHCPFAIRGGGHMSWAGAANIQNGVTIDLSAMNTVTLSEDQQITSVGAGARWQDLYLKLDSMNLAVSGGRVNDVGVAGLTLGGGNSYFAARYGFVCDNVKNFEVVLASGRVVNANSCSHPDLFKALKGGTNNFGIVTHFDLQTFEQGKLWGGFIIYPWSSVPAQLQALQDFTSASGDGVDDYASVINAYLIGPKGPEIVANQYTYTKPQAYPPMLQNFTNIQGQKSNTMRVTNLTDIAIETGAGTPNGYRQLFGTATFANNATLFAAILAIAQAAYQPVQTVKNFQASIVLQPIPRSITTRGAANGGNSLGFDGMEDLVWLDVTIQWSSSTDDPAINNATECLLREAISYAKSQNLYNEYLYLNYALQAQDPIASYGQENVEFLRRVSRRYDHRGVFQRLVPGGFKLWREDAGCC